MLGKQKQQLLRIFRREWQNGRVATEQICYLLQYYSYEANSISGTSGPHYVAVATTKVSIDERTHQRLQIGRKTIAFPQKLIV